MKYRVWCPDMGATAEDGREFEAADFDCAAEEWAEREDRQGADYLIVGGQETTVMVSDGVTVQQFVVSGESVPHYRARRVPDAQAENFDGRDGRGYQPIARGTGQPLAPPRRLT